MSFLAPLFLVGAAAITLPFLFHLIRRSAKEKIPFSSLMFLEASPPRITRRSRLEHLFLLLLRCAIICLLALAFARPFFSRPMAGAVAPDDSLHVAIVVDTSASMQREGLWREAKDRAVGVAREAGAEARIGLFTFANGLQPVLGFGESATLQAGEIVAEIRKRLDAMEPGYEATHLGNGLIGAAELLMDELNWEDHEFGRGRAVVISDLQAGARLDGLQGLEWPQNLEVQIEVVEPSSQGNAGLQILPGEVGLGFATTNTSPRVRIQNSEGGSREQFRVTWGKDGVPVGEPVALYVPPGESRIVTMPVAPEGANQMVLLDDPVAFDNVVWWAPPERHEITLLYHGDTEGSRPEDVPLYFLRRAFEQPGSTLRVAPVGETGAPIGTAPLLIAADIMDETVMGIARATLEAGGTVLIVMNTPAMAASLGALTGGGSVQAGEAAVRNYALLGRVEFAHPLFRPFADARYSDFTKIHFWKYRVLDLSGMTNAVVVAEFDSGDPFLVEIPVGEGRVIAMTSGWAPSESQFALSSKFVPLLYGILEQSLGETADSQQFVVGARVVFPGNVGEVQSVDGPEETLNFEGGRVLKPGIFQAGGEGGSLFAVNLDPGETRVQPLAPERLEALGLPMNGKVETPHTEQIAAAREEHRLASEAESQQKLWRWLLLGAVSLLFLEMFYAGKLSRRVTAEPDPAQPPVAA